MLHLTNAMKTHIQFINYEAEKKIIRHLKNVVKATVIAIIMLMAVLLVVRIVKAEISDTTIVNSIYIIEGGTKAQYAYGIRSIPYKTIADARRYCLNTVRNNRKRYANYGYKQYPDFLSFLASRYCPTQGKLSKTEKRLNGFWLRNLRYQLAKQQKAR